MKLGALIETIAVAIFFCYVRDHWLAVQTATTLPPVALPACDVSLVTDYVARSMRFALFALVSLDIGGHVLAQTEFPTDEVGKTETVYWLPDSLSIKVAKRFGIADAQRDIKAGIFRRYVYDDGRLATALLMFDPKTGYRVNRVIESYGRKPSDSFTAWLQAYNQVMREWHDSHN